MAGSFEQRQNEVGHAPFEHAATPFWPKPTPHVDVFAFADSLLSSSASGFVQRGLCSRSRARLCVKGAQTWRRPRRSRRGTSSFFFRKKWTVAMAEPRRSNVRKKVKRV